MVGSRVETGIETGASWTLLNILMISADSLLTIVFVT